MFLKLGAGKGCQGFRETKMRIGGPKFACTSVNEGSVLITMFLSVILLKILFNKGGVYHFDFLI